ncbi:MAG: sulfotransferase, partial [Acidimicrobiales bacterium]
MSNAVPEVSIGAQNVSEIRPAFLLSLPRSGSTLLQRLLGAHSMVATVAEPWLLIPPLYALRDEGVY